MSVAQFEKDEQFMRLVRREPDVDLVVAALEVARDEQPDLQFEPTLQKLRTAVSELTRPIAMAGDDLSELQLLVGYLTDELNLHGDHDCYEQSSGSYLNVVLESGKGLPIALSVVYMAVAAELGIPLQGIAAPAHFITRLETPARPVYVDPFRNGTIMEHEECVSWLSEITEMARADIRPTLKPASPRQIVIRMLNNLKGVFGSQERWRSAWKVQGRLAALSPGSYRELRDLAIISLRAGRPGQAVTLLENCISVCTPEERELLTQYLKEAKRGVPAFN